MTFQVGVGQQPITPAPGVWMSGFAARTEPAKGSHDELQLQVLVVRDAHAGSSVLVVADLLSIDAPLREAIATKVARTAGVPVGCVSVQVTHTHSGPATRASFAPVNPGLAAGLSAAAQAAAAKAVASVRDASLRRGHAACPGVAFNRRTGETLTDPVVRTASFHDTDGRAMVALMNFACHPVVLGPDNLRFSADWPGMARTSLTAATGATAVFIQGCCGQLNTGHRAEDSLRPGSQSRRTFDEADRIGRAVADAARRAIAAARPVSDAARVEVYETDVALTFADGSEPHSVRLSLHRWGAAALLCLPWEPFIEYAIELRAKAGDNALLIAGYCDDVGGYLPYPPRHYDDGGYEINDAHYYYGRSAVLAPQAGLAVHTAARRLLQMDRPEGPAQPSLKRQGSP